MKVLSLILSFLYLFISDLQAELVKDIQITGNTKTKDWALLRRVNVHTGDELTPEEVEDLRIRLSQNAQYILKSFKFENGILKIEIEDKWSIIPVPLIAQSGDYYMRGVGFYENNFLGRLDTLVPAIAWTNSGINYLLLYNSENFFTPNFGISSLIARLNTLSRFYRNKVEQTHFESRATVFEVTPNFFYKNMVFKAGPIFFQKKVVSNNGTTTQKFDGAGLRTRFNIKYYEQLETLYKGFYVTANNYLLRPKDGNDTFFHGKLEFNSSYPVREQHFVNFSENLGLASAKTFFYQFSEGAHEGFRGYDGESIHMQRYAATTLQYQHHVWDKLYAVTFFENTRSVLINPIYGGAHLNENTIGGGLRYYLKKITIPGINLEYGYNIQDKSSHVHFNVGLKL
ncbi:MAG: POTRA domain-containing protein [Bacteriovorax sp.]